MWHCSYQWKCFEDLLNKGLIVKVLFYFVCFLQKSPSWSILLITDKYQYLKFWDFFFFLNLKMYRGFETLYLTEKKWLHFQKNQEKLAIKTLKNLVTYTGYLRLLYFRYQEFLSHWYREISWTSGRLKWGIWDMCTLFEILIFTGIIGSCSLFQETLTYMYDIALLFQESCRFRGGVSSKKGRAAMSVAGSQPVTWEYRRCSTRERNSVCQVSENTGLQGNCSKKANCVILLLMFTYRINN